MFKVADLSTRLDGKRISDSHVVVYVKINYALPSILVETRRQSPVARETLVSALTLKFRVSTFFFGDVYCKGDTVLCWCKLTANVF